MKTKNFLFYFIIISFVIFLLEVLSYGINKIYNQDFFNVHSFVEKVDDERLITLKKNIKIKNYDNQNWSIYTSSIGTRITENQINSKKLKNKKLPKILFIGDSVPFGWGVNAEHSIPHIISIKNPEYVSINGAIPSYSLGQSVTRFKYEFKGIENLKYVYLQIYDPASQYGMLGNKWKELDNWTNERTHVLRNNFLAENVLNKEIPIYGRPYFFQFLEKFLMKKKGYDLPLIYPTDESDERYKLHIKNNLNELIKHLNISKSQLIIAPVNVPKHKWVFTGKDSDYHLRAIKILNDTLREFSEKNNIKFIDTISILNSDDNFRENFIDEVGHLSKEGAIRVSENLSKILSNH